MQLNRHRGEQREAPLEALRRRAATAALGIYMVLTIMVSDRKRDRG